jgi:TonB family protein
MRVPLWVGAVVLSVSAMSNASAQTDVRDGLPTLIEHRAPHFPAELKAGGVKSGYAIIAFLVGSDGRVEDAVILEADRAEFGDAVLNAMQGWRFKTDGSPLAHREVVRFQFSPESVLMSVSYRDAVEKQFPAEAGRKQIRTVLRSELGAPPERISQSSMPAALGVPGSVAVSFVIDTEGRVRVPSIVSATDERLAPLAINTVKQWRFAPIVHDGMPVLVEDFRSFTFTTSP